MVFGKSYRDQGVAMKIPASLLRPFRTKGYQNGTSMEKRSIPISHGNNLYKVFLPQLNTFPLAYIGIY